MKKLIVASTATFLFLIIATSSLSFQFVYCQQAPGDSAICCNIPYKKNNPHQWVEGYPDPGSKSNPCQSQGGPKSTLQSDCTQNTTFFNPDNGDEVTPTQSCKKGNGSDAGPAIYCTKIVNPP